MAGPAGAHECGGVRMADIEAAKLAEDEPRQHHYEFAHVVLRAIAFRLNSGLVDIAAAGRLTEELRGTWERVGAGLPEPDRIPADGLVAAVYDATSLTAAVITLPAAEHIAEAHFAALVMGRKDADRAEDAEGDGAAVAPSYFLLEHSWTPDDEPITTLTQWTRDGRHLNMGEGPPPGDPAEFVAAIGRVLAIGT